MVPWGGSSHLWERLQGAGENAWHAQGTPPTGGPDFLKTLDCSFMGNRHRMTFLVNSSPFICCLHSYLHKANYMLVPGSRLSSQRSEQRPVRRHRPAAGVGVGKEGACFPLVMSVYVDTVTHTYVHKYTHIYRGSWTFWCENSKFKPFIEQFSIILAWRIPWTEEPGGLQPLSHRRVGCNLMSKEQSNFQEVF